MNPLQLVIIALLVLIAYKLVTRKRATIDERIPGPPIKYPYFGHVAEVLYGDTGETHGKWFKEYGPFVKYYMFGEYKVLITDPALIKYVLLNNHLFDKNLRQYHLLTKVLGRGLVTENDEAVHKYHRSIISPAFAHTHLKALVPIFQQKGQILVEDWLEQAAKGELVTLREDIAKATSDVIGEAAFGYKLGSQRNNSPTSIYSIFANLVGHGFSMWELVPLIRYVLPAYHLRREAVRTLDSAVCDILDKKAAAREHKQAQKVESDEDDDGEKKNRDLLDVLMDCTNDEGAKLTREELIGQTKTFLLAGYETSSVCILWTMHILSSHLDIQQRVADEVISVIGKDRKPSAEDLDKMPYLNKVVKESLRFCPPIPVVVRSAAEDVVLGGYNVPKGTQVIINIYHQHHHSTVWKNPEIFDPERWSNEESEANTLLGSYIPFIMGARNCIGSRFAMLEVRVVLAMILQKLTWTKEPGAAEPRKYGAISMVPRTPIRVVMEARK